MPQKIYYKIVEFSKTPKLLGGVYKTLFHGNFGSRILPFGQWLEAEKKTRGDGGKRYVTGWHLFKDRKICEKYLKKFKKLRNKRIAFCYAKGLRPKPTNSEVFLAEKIRITGDNISWKQIYG